MNKAGLLFLLLLTGLVAHGQDNDEVTEYSIEEINSYLELFKETYKNKKSPEDDAISVMENLKKAHRYLESKGDERTKEELGIQKKIVTYIAKGLKARKRPLVTIYCARVLGEMGDKNGAKPLLAWMERNVLKQKNPNMTMVQYGFQSLAWIGSTDNATLDLMLSYTTGRHNDTSVADHAIGAVPKWRFLKGKDRKELFEKINNYLGSLYSGAHGSDVKKRATYEQRYNTVKDTGLRCLQALSGEKQKWADPRAGLKWWKDNKRRKWADYVGPRFRKKPKKPEPPEKS